MTVCGLEPFSYGTVASKSSFDRRWKKLRQDGFVNEADDGQLRLCADVVQQLAL